MGSDSASELRRAILSIAEEEEESLHRRMILMDDREEVEEEELLRLRSIAAECNYALMSGLVGDHRTSSPPKKPS